MGRFSSTRRRSIAVESFPPDSDATVQTSLAATPPPSQAPSSHSSDCFVRLGRHELVQLGVPGEAVFKGDDVAGTADQPAACSHIGDIAKLGIRDVQQVRQFLPVGGRLIQQDEELRVCQHKAGGIGTQDLIHVLGQAGHETVVLADPLPKFVEKVGAVLIAEQQYR